MHVKVCEQVCACAWRYSRCPWISDGGGAAGGNGLEGIISGWMRGLSGGMDVREGQGAPGTHSKKTKERKDEEKKEDFFGLSSSLFPSKAGVTAAEACLLLLHFS